MVILALFVTLIDTEYHRLHPVIQNLTWDTAKRMKCSMMHPQQRTDSSVCSHIRKHSSTSVASLDIQELQVNESLHAATRQLNV